jgi:hypothetical protein
MLEFLLGIVAGLVGLVVMAAIAGRFLPRDHRAVSSIKLHQPIDRVWSVVSSPGTVPSWWPGVVSSRQLPDEGGRPRWEQTAKGGDSMVVEVVEQQPPHRMKTAIVSPPGAPFGGEWLYELVAGPDSTTLTIIENGWVANPIFRTIMSLMGRHRTIDSYLGALALHLGESEGPIHVK